jgi:hypothetical protein
MALLAVLGASPVNFISESTEAGAQFQIPLSLLQYDPSTGVIDSSGWTPPKALDANDKALLTTLLANLLAVGVVWPAPS